MPVAMIASTAEVGRPVSTPWTRAKAAAVGPGFIVSFVMAILVILSLAIPDYGHAFTMCEAVAKSGRSACKMNAVNMFILTMLLFIFLAPIAFFLTAFAIYVYRLLIKEPLIGLAPMESRPMRARAPIPARRVTVVRELMRDLDLKAPAPAIVVPVMAAANAAAGSPAEADAVVEAPVTQSLARDAGEEPVEALALVELDVEWRDDADLAAPPATETDTETDTVPAPPAATAAPAMATDFATARVGTVDGASIDLLGRLFPKRAAARGDDKIIVLAHERARREEAPEADRRASSSAEPAVSVAIPSEAAEEPDDAIARLRLVAERGLADYLATRLPERVEMVVATADAAADLADASRAEAMPDLADEADTARFTAEVDAAVSSADLSQFTGQSLVATPVVEVPLEEAAAAFAAPRPPRLAPVATEPALA